MIAQRRMWFDNPPSRAKKGRKRKMAKKLYGAAAKAHAKRLARGGYKHHAKSRSRPRRHSVAAAPKRRRRTSTRYYVRGKVQRLNPRRYSVSRRGRRHSVRRLGNPRGIVSFIMAGAIDATEVVLGKASVRIISGYLPASIPQTGAVGLALQVALAGGVGFAAHKFVSPNAGKMVLAGGLSGVIEGFIKSLNIPILSPALGDGTSYYAVGAYPSMSAYPALPSPSGISAYPGMAGDEDVTSAEYATAY